MRFGSVMLAAVLVFSSVVRLQGQSADTSAQARSVLTQALNASGYASNSLTGFNASGTITYFGGGKQQVGAVAIKARGFDQFRMDATLPNGTRTVSFDRNGGTRKEPNGRNVEIPAQNGLVVINPIVPYAELASALSRPDVSVSYVGLVQDGSRQYHQVRTRRSITKEQDPTGLVEDLTQVDYLIDLQTRQIARISSTATATTNIMERLPQVIELESYAGKDGIAVPTVIRLKLSGSPIWEIQLSDLRGNSGLSDSDFTVQ